jgi:MFS family permease
MLDEDAAPKSQYYPPSVVIPIIKLELEPGITILNLCTFLYASMVNVCSLVFVNAAMPYLLINFLHIPEDVQGDRTGDIGLYNELIIIATITIWGTLSDKIGRKIVYVLGFVIMGISLFLHPTIDSFAVLIIYRILFALGASASVAMLTSLLADYPTNESRGRAGGVMGLVSGLGALLGLFGFLQIPKWAGLTSTIANGQIMYWCVAGWLIVSAVILFVGLAPGANPKNKHESYFTIIKDGFIAAKNPKIALSYCSSFAARGDSVVVTSLLSLWINQYEIAHGSTPEHAASQAGVISGVCQTIALISAPLFGFLSDKYDRVFCQTLAALVATVGYFFLFMVQSPEGPLVFIAVSIVGVGEIGMVISSQILFTSEAPEQVRGAASGFFGLCGSLSVLMSSKLGGYLFSNWTPTAPFFLVGIYNALVFIFGSILYWKYKKNERENESDVAPSEE